LQNACTLTILLKDAELAAYLATLDSFCVLETARTGLPETLSHDFSNPPNRRNRPFRVPAGEAPVGVVGTELLHRPTKRDSQPRKFPSSAKHTGVVGCMGANETIGKRSRPRLSIRGRFSRKDTRSHRQLVRSSSHRAGGKCMGCWGIPSKDRTATGPREQADN
jgi:hypothetical protein